jgi:hypothetical protein
LVLAGIALAVLGVGGRAADAEMDMIVPLPVESEHFQRYVEELIEEYAPGNDPITHAPNENSAAFGGVFGEAMRDAKAIDAQSVKDRRAMHRARAAVAKAEAKVAAASKKQAGAKIKVASAEKKVQKASTKKKVASEGKTLHIKDITKAGTKAAPPAKASAVRKEGKTTQGETVKAEAAADGAFKALHVADSSEQAKTHNKVSKSSSPAATKSHAVEGATEKKAETKLSATESKLNISEKKEKELEAIETAWKEHEAQEQDKETVAATKAPKVNAEAKKAPKSDEASSKAPKDASKAANGTAAEEAANTDSKAKATSDDSSSNN